MIGKAISLVESVIISYFLFRVLSLDGRFTFDELFYELLITILAYLMNGRASYLSLHIIASLSLAYMCVPKLPTIYKVGSLFYIVKFFHLKNNLNSLSNSLTWEKIPYLKYIRLLFNFLRYSVLEYLFLGFIIVGYKLVSLWQSDPLPPDFKLYYQMIVTATTIGYGDVCPQTRNQMIYFTITIPLICGSFAVYFNHLTEIFNQTYVAPPNEQSRAPQTPLSDSQPNILSRIIGKLKYINILQAVLVSSYMFRVFSYIGVKMSYVDLMIEIVATIVFFFLSQRKSRIVLNLIASLSLIVLCPIKILAPYKFLCALYFLKFFHVKWILKEFGNLLPSLTWLPQLKYVNFIYSYLRYSLLQYLFVAFTIMGYKFYCARDSDKLPPDYKLYYQWLVTSATIGYGDITPKSDNQIIYLTLMIPIMCYSFVVYFNNLSPVFTSTFLALQPQKPPQQENLS